MGFGPSPAAANTLHQLAFDNAAQAHIIFHIKTGKIIVANPAACSLLGYSAGEILGKKRADIFADDEKKFKKMLLERKATGQAIAQVNAVLKNGSLLPCEISSAIFRDSDGTETSITTISDLRAAISTQKKIDDKTARVTGKNILKAQEKSDLLQEQSTQWLRYFAETSYDVMWDWDISTGKVYVGNSIEDVFGYRIENDTVDYDILHQYLVPGEKERISKKIKKSLFSKKKSWEDSFSIRCKDGVIAATTSRACILRDPDGTAIRLVGATQDVSKIIDLENKIRDQHLIHKEDMEKFRLTDKISFNVIWDWDLEKDELFIGEGFKELFGYTIRKNKGNMLRDWVNYIHPDDKQQISADLADTIRSKAMQWKQAYRIIRANGSIAKVYVRASILRDPAGRAYRMLGAIQDLSLQKELEEQLDEEIKKNGVEMSAHRKYEENFKLIFNSSSDIFYDVDLLANTVVLSNAYKKNLGYKLSKNAVSGDEWMAHIHPEDKPAFTESYGQMLLTNITEWKYAVRYLKADNSVISLVGNSVILRQPDGTAYRIIGSLQDANKHRVINNRLSQEIESGESAMAFAIGEARVAERSEIGKELHDNVNQLLGASKLYMEMAKKGGRNSKVYLQRSTEYTLTAIEEIRKLTKGLTTDTIDILGLVGSVNNLAADIMEVQSLEIVLQLDAAVEGLLSSKVKLNLFRIIQEQINNIVKHADASIITLLLLAADKMVQLTITDNGKGFDVSQVPGGIGLSNMMERANIIHATTVTTSVIGEGTTFTLKVNADIL
ncbi:PAS domain-containing protein [Ferruginibacter sp. HRS2-29]|uniref:PAS domain-containing sensor histidine kinase n=1 Tax=Ferruginibacter sp. HRS2-29 TaxID=2487334 RepID=UPI0020CE10EB|nr:PAS domain-containing protein [Ferruginibacter sp. HRS2-29]MCP9753515.1 PAS domain S-box protein [Ferruginibacter sp. HRS2-29]